MARAFVRFLISFLCVAAITFACVASANSASKARFDLKIEALTAHDEARSRYSIHPHFIFDEIDFRNNQWDKKRAAIAEYDDSFIDIDRTLSILKVAALVLASGFLINYIVQRLPKKKPIPSVPPVRTRKAELPRRTQISNPARFKPPPREGVRWKESGSGSTRGPGSTRP